MHDVPRGAALHVVRLPQKRSATPDDLYQPCSRSQYHVSLRQSVLARHPTPTLVLKTESQEWTHLLPDVSMTRGASCRTSLIFPVKHGRRSWHLYDWRTTKCSPSTSATSTCTKHKYSEIDEELASLSRVAVHRLERLFWKILVQR